ncbi:MAG: hypothetical protein A2060_03995 [Planctomycetes bacterium GWA2_50_13]|nr:MAG: hypothetical protein A2060_03995 [Planctomycetes bacterium GWA2_50_13]OHB96563.1 MAG: hypothetical protein A3I59_00295 [Planctomycetes bacterium RIFCSPLOWO2_02_FULL_50_16]
MNLPGVTVGEDKPQRRDRVVPVEVFRAVTEDVVYVEQTTGSLYAETDVDVRSEVDGIVSKIFFEEGDEVEKGNLLITLDDKEYRYKKLENEGKVKKAEADLDLAKKTLTRMTQLYKEGVISGQDYDIAVSDVEVKEASLETVHATLSFSVKELEDTRILAPISGIVSKKFVDVGEYVTEGSTDMLNIVDVNPVKLEFTVPAKYFSYVKTDEEVSVSIEAYPDEEFSGTIYYINPKIPIETRRFQCYARIPNPDRKLSPGFFVLVTLSVATHPDAVVIPEEAVLSEEGVYYCFRVEEGRAIKADITPGIRLKGGMIEIKKGLQAGDSVVVRGQYVLSDGERVEAKPFKVAERE